LPAFVLLPRGGKSCRRPLATIRRLAVRNDPEAAQPGRTGTAQQGGIKGWMPPDQVLVFEDIPSVAGSIWIVLPQYFYRKLGIPLGGADDVGCRQDQLG